MITTTDDTTLQLKKLTDKTGNQFDNQLIDQNCQTFSGSRFVSLLLQIMVNIFGVSTVGEMFIDGR